MAAEKPNEDVYHKIKTAIGSKWFLFGILILFVVQAGWIAMHSSFPMAFDEQYHLGATQLYAHQWSPFFSNLAPQTAQFGALATDTSFFYHYLMSFPFRVLDALHVSDMGIVIGLRLINVLFFAAGIYLFSLLLRKLGGSKTIINLVLLGFILLPLTSFLAAQINYDNLLFPLIGAALLLATMLIQKLLATNTIDLRLLLGVLAVCFTASIVKYVFLPVFVGIVLVVGVAIAQRIYVLRRRTKNKTNIGLSGMNNRIVIAVLIGATLIAGGLLVWRLGYNLAKYQALNPGCSRVVSVEACLAYPVWARDYRSSLTHVPDRSFVQTKAFIKVWGKVVGTELVSVVDVTQGGKEVTPMKLVSTAVIMFVSVAFVAAAFYWKSMLKLGWGWSLVGVVTVLYLAALIIKNYNDFISYGMAVGVQARYLVPFLIPVIFLAAQLIAGALEDRQHTKAWVSVLVLALIVQGGGMVTYVLRSDSAWYWNPTSESQLQSSLRSVEILSKQKPNQLAE